MIKEQKACLVSDIEGIKVSYIKLKNNLSELKGKSREELSEEITKIAKQLIGDEVTVNFKWYPEKEKQLDLLEIYTGYRVTLFDSIILENWGLQLKFEKDLEISKSSIKGQIEVGRDVKIEVTGGIDTLEFSGHLDLSKNPMQFSDFLNEFKDSLSVSCINYNVSQIKIDLFPGEKRYVFDLKVIRGFDFNLVENVGLKIIEAHMVMSNKENEPNNLKGLFEIGGVTGKVKAEKGKDGNWVFGGEATTDKNIGQLLGKLAPDILSDVKLSKVGFFYNTDGKSSSNILELQGEIDIDGKGYGIKITYKEEAGETAVSGTLSVGKYEFDLYFSNREKETGNQNSKMLFARYESKTGINLSEFLESFTGIKGIPKVELKKLVFLLQKNESKSQSWKIFGIVLGDLYINNVIPVLSNFLGDYKIGLTQPTLVYSTETNELAELGDVNENEINGFIKEISKTGKGKNKKIVEGLNINTAFSLKVKGKSVVKLPIKITMFENENSQSQGKPSSEEITDYTGDEQSEKNNQIKAGPLVFKDLNIGYKEDKVWIFTDISTETNNLTLSLIGVGLGIDVQDLVNGNINLDSFGFRMKGMGLYYVNGATEIMGTLVEAEKDKLPKEIEYRFDGEVAVKATKFSLGAVASYSKFKGGDVAIFGFGVLDFYMPVYPCFIITGLALGFGYNYSFMQPDIESVNKFPLVQVAMGTGKISDTTDFSEKIANSIRPDIGNGFIAAGIRFTTFEVIDTFLLLVASINGKVNFIGKSKVVIPSKEKAVMKVTLVVIGSVDDNGIFVRGKIVKEESYIMFPECRLSGGFAFYSWFKGQQAGDFVLTVGGYHPKFERPDYYPDVERLKFNTKLPGHPFYLKGEIYCALTSSAVMAGGTYEAGYKINAKIFKAELYLKMYADFIFSWKPYYYDADIKVKVGGKVKIHLAFVKASFGLSLTGKLNVYGPSFSGKGKISFNNPVKDISFHISFGSKKKKPAPIGWKEFKESFLSKEVITHSIEEGFVKLQKVKEEERKLPIIDENDFKLVVDLSIPWVEEKGKAGIAPMDIKDLYSECVVKIKSNGQDSNEFFTIENYEKNYPKALWGKGLERVPSLKKIETVAAKGKLVIRTKPPKAPGTTMNIACSQLAYEIDGKQNVKKDSSVIKFWYEDKTGKEEREKRKEREKDIEDNFNKEKYKTRETVLAGYGISDEELNGMDTSVFESKESIENAFVIAPELEVRWE